MRRQSSQKLTWHIADTGINDAYAARSAHDITRLWRQNAHLVKLNNMPITTRIDATLDSSVCCPRSIRRLSATRPMLHRPPARPPLRTRRLRLPEGWGLQLG